MAGSQDVPLQRTGDGLLVRLHVQPGASKSGFAGLNGGRIKVRIQARPVDGAANAALVKLVAMTCGVSKSAVELVRGATSRDKDVAVRCGDAAAEAVERAIRQAAGLDAG
jgi:uncharacterized protein (TIGR00251 family)